jgi:hypothetical protein
MTGSVAEAVEVDHILVDASMRSCRLVVLAVVVGGPTCISLMHIVAYHISGLRT